MLVGSFASVTSFSTNGLTAFAFCRVVMMRSCSISDAAMFRVIAIRWLRRRPSLLPA